MLLNPLYVKMFLTIRRYVHDNQGWRRLSRQHNPNLAGREAAEQALEKAGVEKPAFVFMFASIGYDQYSVLRAVREATGGHPSQVVR